MKTMTAGVPGINAPAATTFAEFYPFYLSQHLHPLTRLSHVMGMTLGWLSVVAAVTTGHWVLAIGLPLFGYGGAIPSHYVWEKNTPASFLGIRSFLWSIGGDLTQFASFYTGRLSGQVAEVRSALDLRQDEVTLADAADRLPHAA